MKTALTIAGIFLALTAFGCDGKDTSKSDSSDDDSSESADKKSSKKKSKGKSSPFKLVKKPSASDVPSGSVKGVANGKAFDVKTIVIEPGNKPSKDTGKKVWKIRLYEKEAKKPTALISKSQFVDITLDDEPGKGKKIVRELKSGGGFFQIQQPGKEEGKLTSWNTKNSYYVEFTEWEAKDYEDGGKPFQVAGKASGKIYVAYQGSKSSKFKDSGVAGEFKDAIVRYMRKPYWEKM